MQHTKAQIVVPDSSRPKKVRQYETEKSRPGKSEPTHKIARLLIQKLDIDADFILGYKNFLNY